MLQQGEQQLQRLGGGGYMSQVCQGGAAPAQLESISVAHVCFASLLSFNSPINPMRYAKRHPWDKKMGAEVAQLVRDRAVTLV